MVKRMEHVNLLHYGDKKGAYQALQEHFHRDGRIHMLWNLVYGLCAGYVVLYQHKMSFLPFFIAGFAIEQAVIFFIDQSNRNWAMHLIDWLDRENDSE